jgi:hypothetical protein
MPCFANENGPVAGTVFNINKHYFYNGLAGILPAAYPCFSGVKANFGFQCG